VDAVVHAPYGSFPGEMPYLYSRDEEILKEWVESSRTVEGSQAYLEKYIYNINDHQAYLARIGEERLMRARETREVR
jgi:3-oxoacid CoA-transferase subunit A/glutaconate CoA-transferase subunit A